MTTFSFDKLDPRRKTQLRLTAGLHTQVANALREEFQSRGLTRRAIADLLNWDKGALTRKLKKSANLTLGTLSDLSFALNREPLIFLVPREKAREVRTCVAAVTSKSLLAEQNITTSTGNKMLIHSDGTPQRPPVVDNTAAGSRRERIAMSRDFPTALPTRKIA